MIIENGLYLLRVSCLGMNLHVGRRKNAQNRGVEQTFDFFRFDTEAEYRRPYVTVMRWIEGEHASGKYRIQRR